MDGAGQQDQGQGLSLASVVGRKQPFGTFIMETKTALDSEVPIPAFLNTGTTRLSSKLTANRRRQDVHTLHTPQAEL